MKLKTYRNIMLLAALIITAITLSQQPSNDAEASTQVVVSELKPLQIILPESDWTKSSEFCSTQVANNYIADGIDTRDKLNALGLSGRPYEILDTHITSLEEAERKRIARLNVKKVSIVASTPTGSAPVQGQWMGSFEEWSAIARQTLLSAGCTPIQVEMMMYIHNNESVDPNKIGGANNNFYGGWQLKKAIAVGEGLAWWDPVASTLRALQYVNGHKYAGYGSGIEAAYNHKKAVDWY